MTALTYHEQTKHHFHRFARSLGYLDWAAQPDPFRRYAGAPLIGLPRGAIAQTVPYDALFDGSAAPVAVTVAAIGEFLRCAMGLSAWKQAGASRWALRVNPSSGNLHPTETYVIRCGRVYHYAPLEHALEERCAFDPDAADGETFLVALTSIHWREAWKYGERAFRYCQHDTGHAIGALRLSAARLGWRLALVPGWSHAGLSRLLGLDRDADFGAAEREDAECLAIVTAAETQDPPRPALADLASRGTWHGTANQLSRERVAWPIIDEVAAATRDPGSGVRGAAAEIRDPGAGVRDPKGGIPKGRRELNKADPRSPIPDPHISPDPRVSPDPRMSARHILLSRRSALAFDGRSQLSRAAFTRMLRRLRPGAPPWDAIDWAPHVHLVLFVHRVEGVMPGIYAFTRDATAAAEWKAAMRPQFLWESPEDPNDPNDLFLLVPIDCRHLANRVSCDQAIAADGFFSLAMIARFDAPLRDRGEWFYRRLFWECGLIGQVLYLEAEAAGARATGIGCFYDDAVHESLGLAGAAWQSLYHFSMGAPVEDTRLTTAPGYAWDR